VADGEQGLLVPVGDDAALAAALAELVDDPDRRHAMGAAARARAEREYSIEHTVAGYQRLLGELVTR
jgi:glycosyltransferase involved in cell wall biosynthesis